MARDFSRTIARLGGQSATVTRRAEGTTVLGRYAPGATSTFDILGSFQEQDAETLVQLPDGRTVRADLVLYTVTQLQVEREPDKLVYNGITYQVAKVNNWQPQANYFKFGLVKVEP